MKPKHARFQSRAWLANIWYTCITHRPKKQPLVKLHHLWFIQKQVLIVCTKWLFKRKTYLAMRISNVLRSLRLLEQLCENINFNQNAKFNDPEKKFRRLLRRHQNISLRDRLLALRLWHTTPMNWPTRVAAWCVLTTKVFVIQVNCSVAGTWPRNTYHVHIRCPTLN